MLFNTADNRVLISHHLTILEFQTPLYDQVNAFAFVNCLACFVSS